MMKGRSDLVERQCCKKFTTREYHLQEKNGKPCIVSFARSL